MHLFQKAKTKTNKKLESTQIQFCPVLSSQKWSLHLLSWWNFIYWWKYLIPANRWWPTHLMSCLKVKDFAKTLEHAQKSDLIWQINSYNNYSLWPQQKTFKQKKQKGLNRTIQFHWRTFFYLCLGTNFLIYLTSILQLINFTLCQCWYAVSNQMFWQQAAITVVTDWILHSKVGQASKFTVEHRFPLLKADCQTGLLHFWETYRECVQVSK